MGRLRRFAFYFLGFFACLLIIAACHDKSKQKVPVTIHRFDKLLFDVSPQELPDHLRKNETEFRFFFDAPLTDTTYVNNIVLFTTDTIVREIYDSVERKYADLGWLEDELGKAFYQAKKHLPAETVIPEVYVLSGSDFEYETRVLGTKDFLAIALQLYVAPSFQKYSYFGLPIYIVNMLDSSYIAGDCMDVWCQQLFNSPKTPETLLDYMVERGKHLYFKDLTLPNMPEHLKIRYSEQQLDWCKKNESFMWSFFIQQNLLYEKDFLKIRTFVNESPKTPGFNDAPGRFSDYLGWQIIKKYVKKKSVPLSELMRETDSQKILKESGYKPGK